MTQVDAAFDRFSVVASRVGADPATILDYIAEKLEAEAPAHGATLPESERRYIEQFGGLRSRSAAEAAFGDLVARQAGIDATRFESTKGVASLLRIDESRVRHRRGAGDLIAYRMGRDLKYPLWQLVAGPDGFVPLPGLRRLASALPPNMHPAEIAGRMSTPQAELRINGQSVSPRDWLIAGGEPDALREVFEDEHTW